MSRLLLVDGSNLLFQMFLYRKHPHAGTVSPAWWVLFFASCQRQRTSCSKERNTGVSKNSTREMPSPSHSIFSVTIPGLRLFPYRMFLTVDGV